MAILDRLYKSNPKDIASGGSQVVRRFQRIVTIGASASISIGTIDSETLPADIARLIKYITVEANPGAAQYVTSGSFQIDEKGAVASQIMRLGVHFSAIGVGGPLPIKTLSCEILMLSGEGVELQLNFNAGAAVNSGTFYWGGYEFPRGSIQR